MALTARQFYRGQPAATNTVLYTTPNGGYGLIKSILLCNTTGASKWVSLYVVDFGDAPTPADCFMAQTPVAANSMILVDVNLVLESGMQLVGIQQTAATISVLVSGAEETPLPGAS